LELVALECGLASQSARSSVKRRPDLPTDIPPVLHRQITAPIPESSAAAVGSGRKAQSDRAISRYADGLHRAKLIASLQAASSSGDSGCLYT
jgi:hypothetical protein